MVPSGISPPPAAPPLSHILNAILPFTPTFSDSISHPTSNINATHLTTSSPDPDQYTIIPATLKILKVLIVELQSASGATALDAAAAADLADEGGSVDDDDWEDEPNPFLDLGSGFSKEQLMVYAAEDGPGSGRIKDDETQGFLVDFFKRAAGTEGFAGEFGALTEEERGRLRECAG